MRYDRQAMKEKLQFASTQRDDLTWVYTVSGHLYGLSGGYAFQDDVRQRVADGARRIVVDLSSVESIDSSGVGILMTIMFSTSHAGGGVVMAGLSEKIEHVLSIAMLLEHIDHAETTEEALAKLNAMTLDSTDS